MKPILHAMIWWCLLMGVIVGAAYSLHMGAVLHDYWRTLTGCLLLTSAILQAQRMKV